MSDDVLVVWESVKASVVALEEDVVKNLVKGNASAGVRARKGLRSLRSDLTKLVKQSMEAAKAARAAKPKREPKAKKAAASAG